MKRLSTIFARLEGISRWEIGRLARGTLAMSAAVGLRTLAQAVVFLLVARVLDVGQYGAYTAILAIASALGNFCGVGAHIVMVREASRRPQSFPQAWGNALAALLVSAPLLFILYFLLARHILPEEIPVGAVLLIGVSELLLVPFVVAVIHVYQVHDKMGRASQVYFAPIVPRLVAALAFAALSLAFPPDLRLAVWSLLYTVAMAATVAYVLRLVWREVDSPVFPVFGRGLLAPLRAGLPFALGAAALKLYTDIDKTMLASLDTLEAAGAYSAGYRVVDFAMVPIFSLLLAAGPRLFREGEGEAGVARTLSYVGRILPVPAAFTLMASGAMFVFAEGLPWVLGTGYGAAVPVLQWLAWLPCVALPRMFLQTLLVGSDRQNWVVAVLLAGAAVNVLLNLWWIPSLGWRGAAAATYVAEIAMGGVMLVLALSARRRAG